MASLMCKYQGRCKCSVRVALVGPERDPHPPQEKYGEAVEDSIDNTKNRAANEDEDASCIYVTHYGVDLEPVNEGGHTERAIVSPDSSACGILG